MKRRTGTAHSGRRTSFVERKRIAVDPLVEDTVTRFHVRPLAIIFRDVITGEILGVEMCIDPR